jgi:hypothetical protein
VALQALLSGRAAGGNRGSRYRKFHHLNLLIRIHAGSLIGVKMGRTVKVVNSAPAGGNKLPDSKNGRPTLSSHWTPGQPSPRTAHVEM